MLQEYRDALKGEYALLQAGNSINNNRYVALSQGHLHVELEKHLAKRFIIFAADFFL